MIYTKLTATVENMTLRRHGKEASRMHRTGTVVKIIGSTFRDTLEGSRILYRAFPVGGGHSFEYDARELYFHEEFHENYQVDIKEFLPHAWTELKKFVFNYYLFDFDESAMLLRKTGIATVVRRIGDVIKTKDGAIYLADEISPVIKNRMVDWMRN